MRATSSLLLAAWICGAQDLELRKRLQDLAAADEVTRDAARAYFDAQPVQQVWRFRSMAANEPAAVRDAFRTLLPHPMWDGVLAGRIGEVRRRGEELLGPDPPKSAGDFARAGARLAKDGDPQAALRLLEKVPAADAKILLPFLESPDPVTARRAVAALARVDEPRALKEGLRLLKEGPDDVARAMALPIADFGSSDLTPELVGLLKSHPGRAGAVIELLQKIGDERAEEPLIGLLPSCGEKDLYGLVQTLSLIGGTKAVAALRASRDALPAEDEKRRWFTDALVRLRDPAAARELLSAGSWGDELKRLGDRSILEELVARVREGKLKIRDRNAALELIGLLGSKDHVDLLVGHLKDDRFRESAAEALGEIGDPRAARPLAEALRDAEQGMAIAEALERLPLAGAEATLLEILEDPEGHEGVMAEAIRLAGRLGGAKVKEKLSRLVEEKDLARRLWSLPAARALGPLLGPDDQARLRPGAASMPAVALALALSGDAGGSRACAAAARAGRIQDEVRGGNALFSLRPESKEWMGAVEAEFKGNPNWLDAAEFLAHRGNGAGRGLLTGILGTRDSWTRTRAAAALAALGDPAGVEYFLAGAETYSWVPATERVFAKALDATGTERLRLLAWSQSSLNQVPARVLAFRRDGAMVPLFRSSLRRDHIDNEAGAQSNTPSMAEALAALGRKEMKSSFLQMLRSRAPGKRALGVRCLVMLEGRGAVPALVPLLDDGDELPVEPGARVAVAFGLPAEERPGRVRDTAVRAIEGLAGRRFEGTPREQIEAARAWCAR